MARARAPRHGLRLNPHLSPVRHAGARRVLPHRHQPMPAKETIRRLLRLAVEDVHLKLRSLKMRLQRYPLSLRV